MSKDENYALLNIKQQGLHLWDIKCNSLVSLKVFQRQLNDIFVSRFVVSGVINKIILSFIHALEGQMKNFSPLVPKTILFTFITGKKKLLSTD